MPPRAQRVLPEHVGDVDGRLVSVVTLSVIAIDTAQRRVTAHVEIRELEGARVEALIGLR